MSYTKTTWQDGDVITAEKLNKLEDGVANAGSVLIVRTNGENLDKTWQEICDSFINMVPVYLYEIYENGNDFGYALLSITGVQFSSENNEYSVIIQNGSDYIKYTATSSSSYPQAPMA